MSNVESLLKAYSSYVKLPWSENLSGNERVWLAVYDPPQPGDHSGRHQDSQIHRTLRRGFNVAVNQGLIGRNPCREATPPRAEHRPMNILDSEQITLLLSGSHEHRLHALFALLVTTGLRVGEATALRWSDLDLHGNRLKVSRTLRCEKGVGLRFAEPKTDRSRRSVYVAPGTTAALKRHHTQQNRERLMAGPDWSGDDLVFCTPIGKPLDASQVMRPFHRVLREIGLPIIRTHDLRHSAASYLLAEGVHPKVVSEMLGHSSITITMDIYSHVLEAVHQVAAARMEKLFELEAS